MLGKGAAANRLLALRQKGRELGTAGKGILTVSGGMAKIMRMAVQSDVQQNSGSRMKCMPGARNL